MLEHFVNTYDVLMVALVIGLILYARPEKIQLDAVKKEQNPGEGNTPKPQDEEILVQGKQAGVSAEAWDDMMQEKTHQSSGVRVLLDELLFAFSLTRIFSHAKAPSFFLIYAHNNADHGQAEDGTVKQFIHDFGTMHAKIRSDRSKDLSAMARTDIFHNQACLLPKRVATDPVDLVVLFHSEVLSSYCGEDKGRRFISQLKEVSEPILDRLYGRDNDQSSLNRSISEYKEKVKAFINNQDKLHHVLTELAFVELRASYDRNIASIIPISLHGGQERILEDLPYLTNTSHYSSMKHCWGRGIYVQQRFFLGLVERMYGKAPLVIDFIKARYNEGIAKIPQYTHMSIEQFRKEVGWQIYEDLRRFSINGPFEIAQPEHHDYSEVWDVPEPQIPSEQDFSFKGLIPQWLLVAPDEKQRRLLELLYFSRMEDRFECIFPAFPGTLTWIDDHASYREWLHNDAGMLGIRGKPGSGKSTVMKYIIEKLQHDENTTHFHLSFFFWGTGHTEQRDRKGFYKSLLHQLLCQIPSAGLDYWRMMDSRGASSELTLEELQRWFQSALLNACEVSRVRLFVDALDEVGDAGMREVVADLRKLNMLVNRQRRSLSICYACRDYPAIVVDNGVQIRVEHHNESDISRYVEETLRSLPPCLDKAQQEKLQKKLQQLVVSKASGMFIYVKLVMARVVEAMDNGESPKRIISMTKDLPEDLEYMYDLSLSRALYSSPNEKADRKAMAAVIRCMATSTKTLTTAEVRAAIASDKQLKNTVIHESFDIASFIEKYSAGLLQVVERRDHSDQTRTVVDYSHQTVKEYFEVCLERDSTHLGIPMVEYEWELANLCAMFDLGPDRYHYT